MFGRAGRRVAARVTGATVSAAGAARYNGCEEGVGNEELITSALRRFISLGTLAGRVSTSIAGDHLLGAVLSGPARQARRTENLVRNATRVVETLGQLKGAAMKVGQMLSLHEGLLPPEVAEVLRTLQRQAPRVPAEVMEYEIRGALDERFDQLFESVDFAAHSAASIGQVHRGRLRDGRRVAIKIQYPLIDMIVKADLKNLRAALQALFALISDVDFEPMWQEVHDRLLEELDYTNEAANMRRMAELHAGSDSIVIPRVIDEATTRNVLTMEQVIGMPPEEACAAATSRELRDRWGAVLFEFMLRGLLRDRFLHADPNLANFAFLPDGRVVVYDFGCVKRVPPELATGYARLLLAVIDDRIADIPAILSDMGVAMEDGSQVPLEMVAAYGEVFAPIYRASPPYTFGEDPGLYHRLIQLGLTNWSRAVEIRFPRDVVFVDRTFAGHLGNLIRLGASGPWRELAEQYARQAVAASS